MLSAAGGRRPRRLLDAVDLVHRWAGGLIGLLLATLGLTGACLLHCTTWLRLTLAHAADPVVRDDARLAALLARLTAAAGPPLRSIRLAGDGLGVHQLAFPGQAGAYLDQAGAPVARWTSVWQRPELCLYDLHRRLFAGALGTSLAGLAALAGLAFVVTGTILWWRTRATFAFRPLPRRLSRPAILRHHRDLGIVAAPLLAISLLSGAMMALKPVERVVLRPFGPAPAAARPRPVATAAAPLSAAGWGALLATAHARFPDGELRWIGLPTRKAPEILVRLRRPGEWTPNGRTIVRFAADGRLVAAEDALAGPLRARVKNGVYPLHTGDALPWRGHAIMSLVGLALGLLGTLTVWSFWFRRPPKRRRAIGR